MFINLTCNYRNLNKHQFENIPLWLRCKSNSSWFGNKTRHESISWKIDIDWELRWEYRLSHFPMNWYWLWYWCEPWVPDWVVSYRTDTWEYRLSCIPIDIGYGIYVNVEFLIELYLVRQILEKADWNVSGLILAIVFVWTLSSWFSCISWDRYMRIQTELYPDWYWLWYSCGLWVPRLSCTWFDTCLKAFIGVRHLLHNNCTM